MNRAEKMKTAVAALWSEDADTKCQAAADLYKWVSEMEDIRAAQPGLTICLLDRDPSVKRAALKTIEYRSELGADIGMAVPALESLLGDPDEEVQNMAWRALQFADQRLNGILEVVESCRPDFVFGRSTRTTICPAPNAGVVPETNPLTGAWAPEPYATVQAKEFFTLIFSGVGVDKCIEDALGQKDAFNTIRAAAYFLESFGLPRVWPGDPNKLQMRIEQAIFLLKSMIDTTIGDPDCEFLERWNNDDEVVISVERQINALTHRLNMLNRR